MIIVARNVTIVEVNTIDLGNTSMALAIGSAVAEIPSAMQPICHNTKRVVSINSGE